MHENLLNLISQVKNKYEPEGFIITGIFGSFARNDQNAGSDMDILYRINETAMAKYPGLKFFSLYEKIKNELKDLLKVEVDLADEDSLGPIGRKYILPEVIRVA